jgi:aryl-alcohol dehydrogenase-like predicted oxidoreductase
LVLPFAACSIRDIAGKINEDTKVDNTDFRNTVPSFNSENRKANQALVDLLSKFAQQKKVTPCSARTRLAACQEAADRSIPGTTKLHRHEENLGAANVDLTPEESPYHRKCLLKHQGRRGSVSAMGY